MGNFHPYFGQPDIYYPNGQQVYPERTRGITWDVDISELLPFAWAADDEKGYQEYLMTGELKP
jgi:hypothetical protein